MWQLINSEDKKLIYKNSNSAEICKLTEIYNGEVGRYFIFDNILTMPYQRKWIFDSIQQHERIGIDKEELIVKLDECLTLLKEGDTHNPFALLTAIKTTIKDSWDAVKTAQLVTSLLIVEEDEHIDSFDYDLSMKKLAKWSKEPKLSAFFLNAAQSKMIELTNISSPSTPNVLETI